MTTIPLPADDRYSRIFGDKSNIKHEVKDADESDKHPGFVYGTADIENQSIEIALPKPEYCRDAYHGMMKAEKDFRLFARMHEVMSKTPTLSSDFINASANEYKRLLILWENAKKSFTSVEGFYNSYFN